MLDIKKLTGKRRYRVQPRLFRKPLCVLQVEEYVKGTHFTPDPYDFDGHKYERTYWRDAVVEDLTNA